MCKNCHWTTTKEAKLAIPAKPLAKLICSKSCLRPQIDAFVSYFALHTLRSTLYASHFPPHTSHFTPHTPEFPLHTLHTAFPTQHSTFFTLHTLHSTPFHIPQSAMRWYGSRGKWKNVQDCSNNLFHTSFLRDCIQVRCFFCKNTVCWGPFASKHCCDPCNVFCRSNLQGSCAGQGCGRRCELKSCMMFRRVKKHRGCPVVW